MTELRICRNCGKQYDPREPWSDHDTMEESAWKDINDRLADKIVDAAASEVLRRLDNA